MIKNLKSANPGEPACRKRSDDDHLRFMIHRKEDDRLKFDFTIELDGMKSWAVPDLPSMNPHDLRRAEEDEMYSSLETTVHQLTEQMLRSWDRGNYIPIDDNGNVLCEDEALECLRQGSLKFFLQGKKLVGEFVLMKREKNDWLLIKRHDEFASYNYYSYELAES